MPALAVADALRDRGAEVEFVGGERAEAELVPGAGYPFHKLAVAGLDRRNPLRAARALGLAVAATGKARALLRRVDADVVLGGGGYVAAPVGLAAASLRVPLALAEADSHFGVANRLLAPFARRVFLAFELPDRDREKYVVTGRPIPAATGKVARPRARAHFAIGVSEPCLLVFGGSLGARSLNFAAVEAFAESAPCAILHTCGHRDYAELRAVLADRGDPAHYHLHAYAQPFSEVLATADLVAARAGGSVFELAAAGLPAILVPYPHATGDHQAKNARWMAEAGAAVVIPDAQLDAERLAREVAVLLADRDRLEAMSQASRALARPDAAERIADETLALL